MITEKDLQEAIAECQGKRRPTASDCIKLAAFYTIRDHLYPDRFPDYSFGLPADVIEYEGKSDFANAVNGKKINDVLYIMDDLMNALQVLNPKLYEGVMRQLD